MTSKEVITHVILLLGLSLFAGCSEDPVSTNASAAADIIDAEIAGTDLQIGAPQEEPATEPEIESPVFDDDDDEQLGEDEINQELEDLIGPQPEIASREVEQILRGNSENQENAFDREFEDAFEEDSALDILKGRGGNLPNEQISPHTTVPPVTDDKFALLLDSIFSQKLFDYRSQLGFRWYKGFIISGEIIGGNPWAEWHLNKVNNVGDIHRVIVRFEHPEHIGSEEEIASSYYIDLLFNEERAAVKMDGRVGGVAITNVGKEESYKLTSRHSLPTIKDETGGLRVIATSRQQHRFFLPGRNGTGMVVVVPATGKYAPRGILLCPRDYDIKRLKAGYRAMDYTGYEMVGAQFEMEGIAQAIVKTGFGPGFVSATMQTTPNIVPSQQVYDSSTTVYPEATVVYVPREGVAIPVAKSKGTINAGFALSSVLHNSFKHRAESRLEKAVTIKSIDIKTPFALAHRRIQFRVKPGPCYALIKEERGRHTFSKEPLPHRPNDTADLPNTPEELDAFLLGKDSPSVPGEDF